MNACHYDIMSKKVKKVLEVVGWVLIIYFVFIGLFSSIKQIPPRGDSYNPGFAMHPVQTILHALPGVFFMLIGPLQFVQRLRSKYMNLHRWMGRLFMISCMLIGLSGITIAITFPYAGLSEQLAIYFYAIAFLFSLYKSYYHVKRKEIALHREWIIRVFSIGLGISLIRILIAMFMIFTSYRQVEIFALTFWVGFGTTWLVGEGWIMVTRNRRQKAVGI